MAFRRLSVALLSLCVSAISGCGDDDDRCGEDDGILLPCDGGVIVFPDGGPIPTEPDGGDIGVRPLPSVGEPCTPERGCRSAIEGCVHPGLREGSGLGGAGDPIEGHPEGEDTFVSVPFFPGGYCTTSYPEEGVTAHQCNLRDPDQAATVCGHFSRCTDLFGLDTASETADFVPGLCAEPCSVTSLSESDCREGYDCLPVEEVCLPGCQADDECRIAREETNGIAGLQTPADCEADAAACTPGDCGDGDPEDPDACSDPATNFDRLVYDTTSEAVCDPVTARCTGGPSTSSASGGDACTEDRDCEAGGICLTDAEGWPGGSCTKVRCDLEDNPCANEGVCQEPGLGFPGCLQGCAVGGVDPDSEPGTWVAEGSARSTCREGYGCFWGGEGAAGEVDNGVCLPVDYETAVSTPNVGATCASDADCFSPFAQGFCIEGEGFDSGYCSVRNCAAPWFTGETNVCGAGAECVAFDPMDPTFALCVQTCEAADECTAGLGCLQFTEESKACWPGCAEDGDCRAGETCRSPGEADSACVSE